MELIEPVEPVEASVGWGVLHLFYRVDRARADADAGGAKRVLDAIARLESDGVHQVLCFAVLGHKADLGIMALGPDLARLQAFQHAVADAPLVPLWSYVSLTELSEYGATDDDERARLRDEEGITDPAELAARLAAWSERMAHYRENRIHPRLPHKRTICFYPMSKRRAADANWYELGFDERKHADGGPRPCGSHVCRPRAAAHHRIDGSRRLGVGRHAARRRSRSRSRRSSTRCASTRSPPRYAEFGPFVTGLVLEPAEALARVGLRA